jgi:hypothetical protein
VFPAQRYQVFVVHGLHAQAEAIDFGFSQRSDPIICYLDGVGFQGYFRIVQRVYQVNDRVDLLRSKQGRRSTTEVESIRFKIVLAFEQEDFIQKSFDVTAQLSFGVRYGEKAAVTTFGKAERYVNIDSGSQTSTPSPSFLRILEISSLVFL